MQQAQSSGYLDDAVARLRALYGARFAGAAVRSPAPGAEPEEDAEMELLVILRGQVSFSEEIFRISGLGSALDLEYGTFVPITPVSEDDFARPERCSPYLRLNILDAVPIA
jgi:hypothetical protein